MVSWYGRLQKARRKKYAAQEKVNSLHKKMKKAEAELRKRKSYEKKMVREVRKRA